MRGRSTAGGQTRPEVWLAATAVAWVSLTPGIEAQDVEAQDIEAQDVEVRGAEARGESADYAATARTTRPIPAGSNLDPTASATVIELRDRVQSFETLDSVLRDSPGARTTRVGAYGGFTTLSLRGTEADQLVVLLGDLPLGPAGGGAFDLSTVPVSLLERVEVYRGGAPLWLGAGAIGGVLRLVPRAGQVDFAEASVEAGSFGLLSAQLSAGSGTDDGATRLTTSVGAVRTRGDFPFEYDPTPLTEGDESNTRRRNGQLDEAHGLMHVTQQILGGSAHAFLLGIGRTGGVPGPAIQQTSHTRRSLARVSAGAAWETLPSQERGPTGTGSDASPSLRLSTGLSYERNRFTDRFGEIGLGAQATDDRSLRVAAQGVGSVHLTRWLQVSGLAAWRMDRYVPDDMLAAVEVDASERHVGSIASEARLHGTLGGQMRSELRTSVRLELSRARLSDIRFGLDGSPETATTFAPTLRLSGALEPIRGLAVSASAATATRIPNLMELFGDRGYLVGSVDLAPERSVSADASLVARGRLGALRGRAEARVFALFADDLIRYARTSQYRAVPQNVGSARILGAELGTRIRIGRPILLVGSATWVEARDLELGRRLPLRPRFSAYLRPEIHLGSLGFLDRVVVFVDVAHVGASFADPANLVRTDGRVTLGTGCSIWFDRFELSLSGTDLTDSRGTDVLGFPLPGRSVHLGLTVRHEGEM